MDDAAPSPERYVGRDSKLGELLDQELAAIPFRQWAGDLQSEGQLARRRRQVANSQINTVAAERRDFGTVLASVAVEQANYVAGVKPANQGRMPCLGALENDMVHDWRVDVKPYRHIR